MNLTPPERHADAVVIGAGIIGCATALELARNRRRVLVIDAEATAGAGSTSSSSAIIRYNYSTYAPTAAAWESYHWWTAWPAYLGGTDPDGTPRFIRTGGLFLDDAPGANSDHMLQILEDVGVPYERLTPAQIRARYPAIDPSAFGPPAPIDDEAFAREAHGELGGILTPDAGYINEPQLAAHNLMWAARQHGAEFAFRERVTAILNDGSRVTGVRLASGAVVTAPVVVNVAGPHSDALNVLAGVTDDMRIRSRALRTETHTVPAPDHFSTDDGGVFVMDGDLGSAFRPDSGNTVHISGIEPDCDPLDWVDPDHYSNRATLKVYQQQVYRVARRLPELRIPLAPKGLGALYDVTPDWTPVFDRSSLPGYYMACGTSGNAFKIAPVAGQFMAALIQGCENGHDHDRTPIEYRCPKTGAVISLAAFSRRRHPGTSRNVLG